MKSAHDRMIDAEIEKERIATMRTANAMLRSLNAQDEVTIISEADCNNVVVEHKGKRYTAIHNGFNGLYYVDDVGGGIGQKV